ncbi:sodium:proton antiporter, partial [Stutzerimonas stutzeri]
MSELLLDGTLGVLLLGLAAGALHARQLYAAVLLFIAFGLILALVWARLGAADLALAEAAIDAGLTGVLLFAALARRLPAPRRLAVLAVLLPLFWLLFDAVAPLAAARSPLPAAVEAALPDSGVSHPVTAVLLNFRA